MSRPRLGSRGQGPEFLKAGAGPGSPGDGSGGEWHDYDFAVVRVVPHVHLEIHVNVGVVVHARTPGFLEARILTDPVELSARVPEGDPELLSRYLDTYRGIAEGDEACGPVALAPPSERFHWLTAPRSDVIQASRVHSGRTRDLEGTVERLYREYVG